MTKLNFKKAETPQFTTFIKEKMPTFEALQPPRQNSSLKVPRQLNNAKEEALLDIAFRYLFHLNVARETRASFDMEQLRAIAGNRLVKKQHPLNLIYDFQYVAAKTQIKGYLHNAPYTVPYHQRALRIYGRCFLFAQLDLIAQTGVVPEKLDSNFYFLPKGSFLDEFEQLNELALTEFISQLSSNDHVQFHPTLAGGNTEYQHSSFLLEDKLVLVDTSDVALVKEEALVDLLRIFFLQKTIERYGSTPPLHPFTQIGLYRARFGELVTLDLEAYYGDSLEEQVDTAAQLLQST